MPAVRLTPRQSRVAELVAQGLQDKEVANILDVHYDTVGAHLRKLYKIARVHNRVNFIRWYHCNFTFCDKNAST